MAQRGAPWKLTLLGSVKGGLAGQSHAWRGMGSLEHVARVRVGVLAPPCVSDGTRAGCLPSPAPRWEDQRGLACCVPLRNSSLQQDKEELGATCKSERPSEERGCQDSH